MFNPFDKDFQDIDEEELHKLENVSEGWFVEYKREKPSAQNIAKSIASFSNSYGGLFFVGIESDHSNKAIGFPGVSFTADVIRDAVRGNLNPFPYFDTHSIHLSNGNCIIMAIIPEGDNPPYIHKNGRIYRRQEAASDPVPENDRYTVDTLFNRSMKNKEKVERFRNIELDFSEEENEWPYLEIFINTIPFNQFNISGFHESSNWDRLLEIFNDEYNIHDRETDEKTGLRVSLLIDTINSYYNSIVLRCLKSNALYLNGLTIEIDSFGNLKVLFPLQKLNIKSEKISKEYRQLFYQYENSSIEDVVVIDGISLYGGLIGLPTMYVKYLHEKNYENYFGIKMRLVNCWKNTLYFQSDKLLNHIAKYGIPICMKSEQLFPDYPVINNVSSFLEKPFIRGNLIFVEAARALGLPYNTALESAFDVIVKSSINNTGK